MIKYLEYAPSSALTPFIECFWTLKSHADYFNKRELIIPGGRTELMFNLGDPVMWTDSAKPLSPALLQGAYLLGPRNRPFFAEHKGSIDLSGVRFRHGGLSAFTAIPMKDLMNEIISQDHVFGGDVYNLTDQLANGVTGRNQVALTEAFLLKHFQEETDDRRTMDLITEVKKFDTDFSLKNLTEKTGVHYKKLERVFSKHTGYSPKNFSRVVRFYKALRQMQKSPGSLTGIGLENGYYDQSHFVRDFKKFTGRCPTHFQVENPTIANLLLRSKHV